MPFDSEVSGLVAQLEVVDHTSAEATSLRVALASLLQSRHADLWTARNNTLIEGDEVYVCYLDADGFSHRSLTEPANLYAEYLDLRRFVVANGFVGFPGVSGEDFDIRGPSKVLTPYAFSDSWFFPTVDRSDKALREISALAALVSHELLCHGMPARGGVARGRLWWNPPEQTFVGPAIVDAYRAGESLDCFGIAFAESCEPLADAVATAPLLVPIKGGGERLTRFVRASAAPIAQLRGGVGKLQSLRSAYAASDGAKARVIRRYDASVEVVAAMFGEPAQ